MDPQTLLTPAARQHLEEERRLLRDLLAMLRSLDADPETVAQLEGLVEHLDELFLVVVVGEFNAGKSTLLNALFGEKIMEEGPIPTTAKITVVRHGPEPLVRQRSEFLVERRHPAALLRHLNLVDTPGTNSIVQRHQEITEGFIPRADLVLFVTSMDRPLSESERQFLQYMREAWGKQLVFVLNKVDQAAGQPEQLEQVLAYLAASCEEEMGFVPRIFPVSARQAFAAKTTEGEEAEGLWADSGFAPFERYLTETLAGPEQLRLKLTAPLDAADRQLAAAGTRLAERRVLLEGDQERLAGLRAHLEKAERFLGEGYHRYLAEVDNLLLHMERRGVQFLEDNIRVGKLRLLRDRDAFKETFRREVIRGHEREVEDHLGEAVDWLLRHVVELWQEMQRSFHEQLRARPGPALERGTTLYNRTEVFEKMRREAERRSAAYDLDEEARRILENARSAAALFLGAEGVAASIGTVATLVIATTAVDVTGGLLAAGVLAAFGFLFLPRQKRKAIREFKERVEALRGDLELALQRQFDHEIEEALARMRDLVAPFAEYVEEEGRRLGRVAEEHRALGQRVHVLRDKI